MSTLVEKADKFVLELFKNELPETFVYHNYIHTQRVVKSTNEIIENSEIGVKDAEILRLAAWLHDTGYTKSIDNHEEESIVIAKQFLNEHNADTDVIEKVTACILATKFNSEPNSFLEEVIRDADSSHFAKKYFEETSEFLRQELRLHNIKEFTTKEWIQENIEMFTQKHKYYTNYALRNWVKKKDENLLKLIEKQKKRKKKNKKEALKAQLKAKYKNESPERGIQTLFRVTLRNHIKLSDIADTKANILLSVNAIIISLALANLIPKLDSVSNQHLLFPSLILVLFSVASIILSIMSTRPNVTTGEFTKEQVQNKEINVLFFGNFHKMPYQEYKWAIQEIIKDKEYVYESLTKDLYFLGIVLNRKYKLLRLTYTVFMIGIIVSVIAFIVAFYYL
ncbi:Pycsar system effector family protein [Aquimarina sp. 2-A2]|uniref:HD domain-containing protein n=1 Tax=Aquimarina intermedia TaxID=350814 RepID=A0A5S5BSM3_9FLAO|nr:Pycsar system effector family protein [Aquimarina intermedia]TYP70007.1 HD domain-containing protein [Aquimarina intermedia]